MAKTARKTSAAPKAKPVPKLASVPTRLDRVAGLEVGRRFSEPVPAGRDPVRVRAGVASSITKWKSAGGEAVADRTFAVTLTHSDTRVQVKRTA